MNPQQPPQNKDQSDSEAPEAPKDVDSPQGGGIANETDAAKSRTRQQDAAAEFGGAEQSAVEPSQGAANPESPSLSGQAAKTGPKPAESTAKIDPLILKKPRKSKKWLIVGLILAVAVLMISGGAALSYYNYVNRPENVLKQALANAMDADKAETVHFSGEMSSSFEDVSFTYKGAIDSKSHAFSINGEADAVISKIGVDLRSMDAKTFYLRLSGLEGFPAILDVSGGYGSLAAPLVDSVNNQWIEINGGFIKELGGPRSTGGTITESDKQK